MSISDLTTEEGIFRPFIKRFVRAEWLIVTLIFFIQVGLSAIFRTIALIAIWLWLFLLLRRPGRREIGLRSPQHWGWWLVGPLLGLVLVSVTAAILWLIWGWGEHNMFTDMAQAVGHSYQFLAGGLPAWVPLAVLGFGWLVESPLLEGPLFRSLMFGVYRKKWGDGVGIVIQALAFTLVHPLHSVSWVVSIFVAGIGYALITKYSQSLWPAVLAHSAYNLGIIWIAFQYYPHFVF